MMRQLTKTIWFTTILGATVALVAGCGGKPNRPMVISAKASSAEEIRAKLMAGGPVANQDAGPSETFGGEYATLKGKFVVNGQLPANKPVAVSRDLNVCKPGGREVAKQVFAVGSGNELANVLVFAEVPPEWCHESMKGNNDTVEFDQKNCLFINRIFPFQTTQTLKILNSDPVGHNAALKPAKSPRYDSTIPGGGSDTYPPAGKVLKQEKKPFTVSCSAHPWMQSHMIIRDNGYYDVTQVGNTAKPDGTFELSNLPAGVPVTITVWHEAVAGLGTDDVSIQPEGMVKKIKRGSFTVNLEPGSMSEMTFAINSSAFE